MGCVGHVAEEMRTNLRFHLDSQSQCRITPLKTEMDECVRNRLDYCHTFVWEKEF